MVYVHTASVVDREPSFHKKIIVIKLRTHTQPQKSRSNNVLEMAIICFCEKMKLCISERVLALFLRSLLVKVIKYQ